MIDPEGLDDDWHECPVCADDCNCARGAIDGAFCTCCESEDDPDDDDPEFDEDEDVDDFS